MRKFPVIIALFALAQQLSAQNTQKDTTAFEIKKLKESDLSVLFSYYAQDGNNSPVTGGIGTEQLTDVTSKVIVNIPVNETTTISFDGGFDYYSSASTDKIDAYVSSASSSDVRVHGNFGWNKSPNLQTTYGFKVGGSKEYDYTSFQFSGYINRSSKDGNSSFGLSGQAFIDKWVLIYPAELRSQQWVNSDQRRSYSVSASYSQVINKRMQASVSVDFVSQSGLLSTPFHRVYFSDQASPKVEKLPFNRIKIPIGFRLNYYASDLFLFRAYYRYYWDDWGVESHTASLEIPVKINRFFSVYPFYRYHTQAAANYFGAYGTHITTDQYYTSDYDLSALESHNYGLGIRYSPANGIKTYKNVGKKNRTVVWKEIDFKYGHYTRSPSLSANIFSLGVNFSF